MRIQSHHPVDRVLFGALGVFLLSSTFSIALSQTALGVVCVCLLIVIARGWRPLETSLKWWYVAGAVWLAWLLLTSLINDNPMKSLAAMREEWLFAVVFAGVYVLRQERYRRWLLAALAVSVTGISLYGVVQYFTGVAWTLDDPLMAAPRFGWRAAGFFTYNTFQAFFAVAAAMFVGLVATGRQVIPRGFYRLYGVAAAMTTIVSLLSFGRSSVAALVLSIVFLLVVLGRRYWKVSLAVLLVLIIALALVPGATDRYVDEYDREMGGRYQGRRLFIWDHVTQLIGDHPWIGVGKVNFRSVYVTYLPENIYEKRKVTHAHNEFLHAAAISGIPGAVLFGVFWALALGIFWRGLRRFAGGWERAMSAAALAGS
ncbi:MAG: O-antigen ligase family protein, partial [candidate division Zixibacteria bacterium]|nr:O-antigen ligase family protein [candidate division Zixibacteria bacterium]